MSFQEHPERLNPNNCTSSHGAQGFLFGTVHDKSTGLYICPCGRQYFSNIVKPDEVKEIKSYQPDTPLVLKTPEHRTPQQAEPTWKMQNK